MVTSSGFSDAAPDSPDRRRGNRTTLLNDYRHAVSKHVEVDGLVVQFAPAVEAVMAVGAFPGRHEPDSIRQIEGVAGTGSPNRIRQDVQRVVALRGPRIGTLPKPRLELVDEGLVLRGRRYRI